MTARRALAVLSLAASGICGSPGASALDPTQHVTQYSHRVWNFRDGFVKGQVNHITQASDGYLLLGTSFGLVRFDGVRAIPWVPPSGPRLPSRQIVSLLTSRDGTVWIGTAKGLVSWKAGAATAYSQLVDLSIASLAEANDGAVWVSGYSSDSLGKLCSIVATRTHCETDIRLGRGPFGLYADRRGALWAAVGAGFWRWLPGPPRFYPSTDMGTIYQGFAEDESGALLIPLVGRMARLSADVLETAYAYPANDARARGFRVLHDRDGADWIATDGHGLIRCYKGASEVFSVAEGLTGALVDTIFEDREGNIWVSTDRGLDRFSPNPVPKISEREGLTTPVSSVLASRDGSVWTSSTGRLSHLQDGHVSWYVPPADVSSTFLPMSAAAPNIVAVRDLPRFHAIRLFEDARGRTWIVGPDVAGYLEKERFVADEETPRGYIYAATGDSADGVWISNAEHGLVHVVEGRRSEVIPWSTFGDKGIATALATDATGETLWIGFEKGGITSVHAGQMGKSFTTLQGLGPGKVSHLLLDADGALWVATYGGLSRLKDGHIDTLSARQGLPCDRLYWTDRADDHSLWLYGDCGIIHITATELNAWLANKTSKIRSMLLDASDGVSVFSGDIAGAVSPELGVSPDGTIWFRSPDGLGVLRPHQLVFNSLAPPVSIESMVANGRAYDLSKPVLLPAGVRNLAIEYTALSFVAPEKIHFRYRLEGQDSDWREVVNDRKVQYSNLIPGNYRFKVLANNNSGVWNEQGATLEFSIAPAYWQTFWFRATCAIALALGLWLLYQIRLRQLAREFERTLDARVAERTRIARELHDTLLQSWHGLLLQFQAVSRLFAQRPQEAKRLLDSAIEQAAVAITEGRDAVQGLRNSSEESNDLVQAIENLARELSASPLGSSASDLNSARPIDIVLEVDGAERSVRPVVRDEIYRVVAEALRNAVQHSHSTRVEVELIYGRRSLRLRVHDDGVGMDADVLAAGGRQGHFGLAGMRERAELAGGKLTVWSAPGVGTDVELTIPGSRAYLPTRME